MPDTKDCLFTGQQTIGSGQPMRAPDLHDTGPFVIIKKQRAFNTTGCHHHTLRSDFDIAIPTGTPNNTDIVVHTKMIDRVCIATS